MTTPKLQACIASIVDIVFLIGGIEVAPDYPEEKMEIFPFLVVYPETGRIVFGPAGVMTRLDNIVVQLHVNRKNLPIDMERVMTYSSSIPNALMKDPTLGATCDTFRDISYENGYLAWANIDTFALTFTIHDVKIQEILA